MKKIAFLISGNIRIHEKNLIFFEELKKVFKDYKISIVSSVWDHQENIEEFKKKYNIEFLNLIKEQNWDNNVAKVKFVDWGENQTFKLPNIFHMWFAVLENIKFLKDVSNNHKLNFDYVCRFRSDIVSVGSLKYLEKEFKNLKNNEILFPSNLHWKGITDLFFISDFKTFLKLENLLNYIDKFIDNKRMFHPEYIFYSFLIDNNFKIKLAHEFNLGLIKIEENKPTKTVFTPLKDKIRIKIAKRKIKTIRILNKIKYLFN